MKIKMLKDANGSRTGAIVEPFTAGEEYDVPDQLAKDFVSTGDAELVDADVELEPKAADEPANKSAGNAPSNKRRR